MSQLRGVLAKRKEVCWSWSGVGELGGGHSSPSQALALLSHWPFGISIFSGPRCLLPKEGAVQGADTSSHVCGLTWRPQALPF